MIKALSKFYDGRSANTPNQRIRVCFVQTVQSPYWSARLRELAKQHALEIVLVLEREGLDHRPGWRNSGIPGVRTEILHSQVLPTTADYKDHGYRVSGVRSIPWSFTRLLVGLEPDVVVVCNATQLLFALPARAIKRFHISLIVEDTLHATRSQSKANRLAKGFLYRQADSWMPYSADAEAYLNTLGRTRSRYKSCWSVDTQFFQPPDTTDHLSEPLTVSVVSALIEQKGILQLVREWSGVPAALRDRFCLKIAGAGPLHDRIVDEISKDDLRDVHLLGQLDYEGVSDLLTESVLFVLPTLQDLCSLSVLEAMACGTPVITTPYNGARDLVESGANGWIADPLEHGALTRCLSQAMTDPSRLFDMGRAARDTALARDNERVMKDLCNHLMTMSRL